MCPSDSHLTPTFLLSISLHLSVCEIRVKFLAAAYSLIDPWSSGCYLPPFMSHMNTIQKCALMCLLFFSHSTCLAKDKDYF